MKLKLVLLLTAWVGLLGQGVFAQTNAEPAAAQVETNAPAILEQSTPSPTPPAEAPADPTSTDATTLEPDAATEPPEATETGGLGSDNRGPLTLDHELPAAIVFLARMANINIHFDPGVTFTGAPGPDGTPTTQFVSLRWDNVTAEDALNEVLDIHGLMMVKNPKTNISRVTKKPTVAPLITSIVQLQHTNPTNMVELVRSTFSDPVRSKVSVDPRTSQLVIVAPERDMEAITNLVAHLDIPTKQVLIEARLLETSKNPRSLKGIDWSGTLEGQRVSFGNGVTSGTTTTRTGDSSTTTLPSGRTVSGGSGETTSTQLTTLLGAGGLSASTARGLHPSTAFLNADGVSAVLSFLNTDNDTEVVANPRAVTADNETARLEVTKAFPIFQVTPGSANSPAGSQVTYTNVGTILNVTPRISANDHVALKVIPEVSNIDSKDVQIVNGTRNEANVYVIRRIEANVVIPSGHTLVMGGLISDSQARAHTKVPILGDLPGIGLAFRKDSKSRSKSNLLIFVTPTIVKDEDFQPTSTNFLNTKVDPKPDVDESAWDSGKPKQWRKSKADSTN